MAYPSPPDWMSASSYSGWYMTGAGSGSPNVCGSDGWSMLRSLQTELHDRLSPASSDPNVPGGFGPLPTFDGSTVDGTGVPANDFSNQQNSGWDPGTLRALWAVASHAGAGSEYLSAVQQDAQSGSGPVSATTLQVGIWVGARYYQGVDQTGANVYGVRVSQPSAVTIPQGTNFPLMDQPPPAPSTELIGPGTCNAIPPNTAALIPVAQTVVPFRFNELLVVGLVVAAVGAVAVLSMNVPVVGSEARREQAASVARASRRNPRRFARFKFWR